MFKKIAVAVFVLVTFVIYSIHQRGEGNQAVQRITSNNVQSSTAIQQPTSRTQPKHSQPRGLYKDGSYTGTSSDAFYGYIQVLAVISGGKLNDVKFLDYPQDQRNSVVINEYAMPILKQQAIQSQSAQVDGVSGATDTSQAFIQSLGDALKQAKA